VDELDVAAKVLMRVATEDVARFVLGPGVDVTAARADETEVSDVKRVVDKVLRVEVAGEERRAAHVEVQANWAADVPKRAYEYWSLARRGFENLETVVVCLKPGNKQGAPRAWYEEHVGGRRVLRFDFRVIRLWELHVDELLAGQRGLLPFVPYAEGATEAHVDAAMRALEQVDPEKTRADLQGTLATYAGNVFPDVNWIARIPRELLMKSTAWKEIGAEFELEGQRKTAALQIETRLGSAASGFVARLSGCNEASLNEVARLLVTTRDDDELANALDALLPPAPPQEAE